MAQQDYLQLIQESEVFKQLDPEMQTIILTSTGKNLEEYARIFLRVDATLNKAKEEFMVKNKEIVQAFALKVKTIKKNKRQADEEKSRMEDEKIEEALLQNIKEITN